MKRTRAFNIVELIVVLAVIGIILAIAIPAIQNIMEDKEEKTGTAPAAEKPAESAPPVAPATTTP